MDKVNLTDLKKLYIPPADSHKGQNGKLLVIGGSHLFHAASLWSLTVASRIVDLVHYCSVPENNEIVEKAKAEFRNGIVVPRNDVEEYVKEDDVILIGPGMTRDEETKSLTDGLLQKFPEKQWVIDAGALQMMDVNLIPKNAILTPHQMEFEGLVTRMMNAEVTNENLDPSSVGMSNASINKDTKQPREAGQNFVGSPHSEVDKVVHNFADKYDCIVLLKGSSDIACSPSECQLIEGGNAGMTKGGTGDVLAGLIAALACKNDPFLATIAGAFINKKAGDALYKKVGPFFNATDLANEIPVVMTDLFI
jgi:NAD(P)H-hydrate repair Nnr-like enzyme with NAD(P)H-hydrate dehydratase domain